MLDQLTLSDIIICSASVHHNAVKSVRERFLELGHLLAKVKFRCSNSVLRLHLCPEVISHHFIIDAVSIPQEL